MWRWQGLCQWHRPTRITCTASCHVTPGPKAPPPPSNQRDHLWSRMCEWTAWTWRVSRREGGKIFILKKNTQKNTKKKTNVTLDLCMCHAKELIRDNSNPREKTTFRLLDAILYEKTWLIRQWSFHHHIPHTGWKTESFWFSFHSLTSAPPRLRVAQSDHKWPPQMGL